MGGDESKPGDRILHYYGGITPNNSLALYLEVFRTVSKSFKNRIQRAHGFNSRSEGSYYRISPVFIGAAGKIYAEKGIQNLSLKHLKTID